MLNIHMSKMTLWWHLFTICKHRPKVSSSAPSTVCGTDVCWRELGWLHCAQQLSSGPSREGPLLYRHELQSTHHKVLIWASLWLSAVEQVLGSIPGQWVAVQWRLSMPFLLFPLMLSVLYPVLLRELLRNMLLLVKPGYTSTIDHVGCVGGLWGHICIIVLLMF